MDNKKIDIEVMQTDASINLKQNNYFKNQQNSQPNNPKIGR
jgi:hypothetical protein